MTESDLCQRLEYGVADRVAAPRAATGLRHAGSVQLVDNDPKAALRHGAFDERPLAYSKPNALRGRVSVAVNYGRLIYTKKSGK